jgi:fucose permease
MVGYFGKFFFKKISPKLVLMIPCAIVICVVVSLINTPVLMYENNYGDFSGSVKGLSQK